MTQSARHVPETYTPSLMQRVCFVLTFVAYVLVCVGVPEPLFAIQSGRAHENGERSRPVALSTESVRAPEVALVTFGPGQLYWERFGHNAIVIDDPAGGGRVAYNYGVFDFRENRFLRNFALGHMHYSLDAESLDEDLATYAAEGRSITVQILNLAPDQARRLAEFLTWNAQPQNAGYEYDYFLNNCSTKVRDALSRALGGAVERQLKGRPAPHTYRFDVTRLMSPDFWFAVGMEVGLGPSADIPLSLWQESFVPMVLSRALRDVALRDASGNSLPLVSDEEVVLRAKVPLEPSAPLSLEFPFLAVGIGLTTLLGWIAHRKGGPHRRSFALLAVAWWLVCGFTGLALAALWGFSSHWAAWANENLLLFDPLCLVLPFVWWRTPRAACWLATFIAIAAMSSLVIRLLPGLYQSNLAFIALAVPVHVGLAILAWRGRESV